MSTLLDLTIADIMNRSVRYVSPDCPLGEVARQMAEAHISSMLVMSGQTPLGIITERDMLRFLSAHAAKEVAVAEVMSAPVLTVSSDTDFGTAYAIALGHHVRHLVVVDEQGSVVGMASETDFRRHLGMGVLRQLDGLKTVMDSELPVLSLDDTLDKALNLMLRERTSYVLVAEERRPVGILTERDIAGLLVSLPDGLVESITLRDVTHSPVLTVSNQTSVFDVAHLMQERQFRHMAVVDNEGRILGVVTLHNLMERIAALLGHEKSLRQEKRMEFLAHFDVLTGLPNRSQLADRVKYAISLAKRSKGQLALIFLDLDHFKNINDTLGHSVGDILLVELSKRLCLTLREEDTVSRLGGDEFILLLPDTDADGSAQVANKILNAISQPYQIEENELSVTASIGIAIYPDDGADADTLSRNADSAMYHAKQEGRNCSRFFAGEMQVRAARNLQLANALRHALERDQLRLHYQPQISMQDGRLIGAEALLRWQHPELGAVSPAEFIPVAEDCGLILPIGEWVLRQAVRQAKAWQESGLDPMIIAVNLSAVQFRHTDLPELVSRILMEAELPAEYLELELTEGVTMHDPHAAITIMNRLHECGVRMSIDDFGTGYSSLSYLKKFKVYKLKIDQSFIRDISTDPEDKAIVGAVIQMSKSLGLLTIAEGVETSGQQAFLREQGCDEVQGYYHSKPLPVDQFEAFARARGNGEIG